MEVFEDVGNIPTMPSQNHVVIRKHTIKNQVRDIHLNAFLKAVYKHWCTSPSMTIFTRFEKIIMQINFYENLRDESEMFHFLSLNESKIVNVVE